MQLIEDKKAANFAKMNSNPRHYTPQNPASIREMFEVISTQYDLANTILSFGIHHLWKRRLVRESGLKSNSSILDCATGTGDLAFLFERKIRTSSSSQDSAKLAYSSHLTRNSQVSTVSSSLIVGSDFCEPMLELARKKAEKLNSNVRFEQADLMNLPYAPHTFDIASISFGIRNVQDPQKALYEMGRVVKPGGRVLVLEFGQPQSAILNACYRFYSRKILPLIGGWVSGQPKAYRYLQTSSATFPCAHHFLDIAFSTRQYSTGRFIPFHTGVAFLYILQKK